MIEAPTPRRAPGLLDGAAIVVTAVELALAGYIWRFGPAGRIPMHFGLHGEVNGWGDRAEAAALIGGLALAMGGLYAVLPAMALGRPMMRPAAGPSVWPAPLCSSSPRSSPVCSSICRSARAPMRTR